MDKFKDTAITILSAFAAILVLSIPVWLFWNWLLVYHFNLHYIDYLESVGFTAFVIYVNSILKTDYIKK